MGVTYLRTGNFINVTFDGSGADWTLSESEPERFPDGANVKSIKFKPSLAADYFCVRNESDAGAVIFDGTCIDTTDTRKDWFGGREGTFMNPHIDYSAQTFGTNTSVMFIIEIG